MVTGDENVVWLTGAILLIPTVFFYWLIHKLADTFLGKSASKFVERPNGKHKGAGGISFVLGVFLATAAAKLFNAPVGLLLSAIAVLTFGDGFASYVGMRWGKHKFTVHKHTKSWEGTTAGVVAATVVSAVFVPFGVAFFGALVPMIVEIIGVRIHGKEIPDNIYIPIVSLLSMIFFIVFYVFFF